MALSLPVIKGIAAAGTFVTGLCGLLVFALKRLEKNRLALVIGYINAFGSGVIIGVGLLHMLGDATTTLSIFYPNYPMSFLLAGSGFAMIYLCEDVLLGELIQKYGQEMKRGGLVPHVHGGQNHNSHEEYASDTDDISSSNAHNSEFAHTENLHIPPHSSKDTGSITAACGIPNISNHSIEKDLESQAPQSKKNDSPGIVIPCDTYVAEISIDRVSEEHSKPSDVRTTFFALTLLAAVSVHSFFGGLGLGVEPTMETVWPTFAAIVAHKGVAAFVIGNAFMKSTLSPTLVAILLILFACVTPVGIAIGLALSSLGSHVQILSGCLIAVSAGSFLYVGALILKEDAHPNCPLPRLHNWYRFALWYLGFGIMAIAAIWA